MVSRGLLVSAHVRIITREKGLYNSMSSAAMDSKNHSLSSGYRPRTRMALDHKSLATGLLLLLLPCKASLSLSESFNLSGTSALCLVGLAPAGLRTLMWRLGRGTSSTHRVRRPAAGRSNPSPYLDIILRLVPRKERVVKFVREIAVKQSCQQTGTQ